MSQRVALRRSHHCSAIHHADGSPQYKQDLVAGALTANAPPPQGRTRPDALVTLAGFARRRREIWRNPSSLGEGVALQNGAQGSAAEMRMLCPTGSEHIQERYICVWMICPILGVRRTLIARGARDGYQLCTVRAEGKARRKLAAGPFVGEHGDFPLELFYRTDEVAWRGRRRRGDMAG